MKLLSKLSENLFYNPKKAGKIVVGLSLLFPKMGGQLIYFSAKGGKEWQSVWEVCAKEVKSFVIFLKKI